MAADRRTFHIGDLVSVTTGCLVSPNHMGGVYEVVDYITGQAHMTHQLPRGSQEITPELYRQHPWLADVTVPESVNDEHSALSWLAWLITKYGEWHEVEPMPLGVYVGREPLAELREMAPHMEIITVELPDDR